MKTLQWKISLTIILLGTASIVQSALARQFQDVAEVSLTFSVRYVTPEAVYFNGGTVNGIRAGDRAWVVRNGQRVTPLEVKYVSERSACCLLKTANAELGVNVQDLIVIIIPREEALKRARPAEQPAAEKRAAIFSPQNRLISNAPKRYTIPRRNANNVLNGQISMQAFGQHDRSAQRYDFIQPSAYLRFNFERPAGLPLRFIMRGRSSQNFRKLGAGSLPQQPALHRVYEMALEFTAATTPVEVAMGRMLRNELRGVGYLDGIALGYHLNSIWKAGVFYGAQPNPYDYKFSLDEKKLGGFVQMKTAVGKDVEVTASATGAGQYLHRRVSREYLAVQADLNFARQMYFTNYFEIDLNRAWRKRRIGHSLDLSNAYFNAAYYPRRWISVNASYDAHRLVRTWETYSLADSLFDQALRQGWRGSVSLQPAALVRFTLDGGVQKHRGTPEVYSAGIFASVSNFLRSGVSVSGRLSYFGNALSAGYYPALDLSRSFFGVVYATVGGGAYIYRMGNSGAAQFNPWERLRLDINLTRRFFLSGAFENFHGDTMQFVRGFADVGWRF
jgi:hypothetical protein